MNEQDDEVAHPGNGNNTSQATVFRPNWQFAIDRVPDLRLLENCQSSPGNNLGINIPAQQQIDGSQIV
jgi:hypothetical protein